MADVTPFEMATFIKNAFAEQWHIQINDEFAQKVATMAIKKVTYDDSFGLLTNTGKKIIINIQSNEERNKALQDIKKFVDIVLKTCEGLINNEKTKTSEQFAKYFCDKQRMTQLYTSLAIKIAQEFSLQTSEKFWTANGYQPFA